MLLHVLYFLESYFHGDDVACFPESDFENLPTGATANLPLADQVRHLGWIPLHKRGRTNTRKEQRKAAFYANPTAAFG